MALMLGCLSGIVGLLNRRKKTELIYTRLSVELSCFPSSYDIYHYVHIREKHLVRFCSSVVKFVHVLIEIINQVSRSRIQNTAIFGWQR